MQLSLKTLISLFPYFLHATATNASGSGKTTRYWDCCKPSCAWSGKAPLADGFGPVNTCSIKNSVLAASADAASACSGGGSAYQCSNESPWAVSDDLAYGYAAVNIAGGSEQSWCCACYELTFTSGPVKGKKMIVQATNTGSDLEGNQFDLSIPGGGVGIFNACTAQYGAPSTGWGAQYGGIAAQSSCDDFPEPLKAGCNFRFDWFMGADNPSVDFKQVSCPAALTANTGCKRADDASAAAPAGGSGSSSAAEPAPPATVSAPAPTSTEEAIPEPTTTTVEAVSAASTPEAASSPTTTFATSFATEVSTSSTSETAAATSPDAVTLSTSSTSTSSTVAPSATAMYVNGGGDDYDDDDDTCEL